MTTTSGKKREIARIQRLVIKIGSGVISSADKKGIENTVIQRIIGEVSRLHGSGIEVILVSSGAIAMGIQELDLKRVPADIALKQATAAVGQTYLIGIYERSFKKRGVKVAQLLLTHGDFSNRQRYLNVRTTIMNLLNASVVPIINENDTVAVDEIKFGDNDALSSMVANLVEADMLIILSDVKGLYSADPRRVKDAVIIPEVKKVTNEIEKIAGRSGSVLGTGGMYTKVQAAKRCASAGISTVIVDGREPGIINRIIKGESVGTTFLPEKDRLSARERWIAHTLKVKGHIYVDSGARKAILSAKKSILPVGLTRVEGTFQRGDAVSCRDVKKKEFARGLVNYKASDLMKIIGVQTSGIRERLGYKMGNEVIHRDNLVILEE